MPFTISLALSNSDLVYTPNSNVEGFLTFELHETIKVKAIRVCIEGVSSTKWMLSESGKTSHGRSREVSYSAKVAYLSDEQLVWRPSQGHAKSSIFPGCHVYPFKFAIPANVPPSFDGDHGHVRYHVKACVERPWKTNRCVSRYFTVLPPKDLNQIPMAAEETSSWKSKNVGFVLFRYGKVNLQIRIPKKGYVGGETICVEASVENCSSRSIVKSECYLVQQCRYLAYRYGMGGPSTSSDDVAAASRADSFASSSSSDRYLSRKRDENRIVTTAQSVQIGPHDHHHMKMHLKIPCTCPSFDSSLIHVEYYVAVKLHVKCRFRNTLKTECPIIIGSIPLFDEHVDPRTPTLGDVTLFSARTQRSLMSSADEKLISRYVYYPKFGKSLEEDDDPPSLSNLQLPPIDSISDDDV